MKKLPLLLTIAIAAFAGTLLFSTARKQPAYQGVSISEWLRRLDECHGSAQDEARAAFNGMGFQAVPWLRERIKRGGVAPWLRWKFDFKRLPGKEKILIMTAATALGDIGPPASNAIPDLVALSRHEDYWVRSRATGALMKIRGERLDLIKSELENVRQTREWNDLHQLLVGLGPAAEPVVPTLVSLLDDTDPRVYGPAADILYQLRLLPEIAVPALAKNLSSTNDNVRFSAATALNGYGSAARTASKELIEALHDRWDYVAHNALLAIEKFSDAPEATQAVPVIRELLQDEEEFIRKSAQRTLMKIQRASR